MESKITYPLAKKYSRKLLISKTVFMWLFLVTALGCIILNIWYQGYPWSVVAVFGLWWLWTQFVSPDTTGYNRIYQFVKFLIYLCILLILILLIFQLNWRIWSNYVFPCIIFPALLLLAILLFTDFRKQQFNIIPLILFDIYAFIGSTIILAIGGAEWPVLVLWCVSTGLLLATGATMSLNLFKEFKKYFSLK